MQQTTGATGAKKPDNRTDNNPINPGQPHGNELNAPWTFKKVATQVIPPVVMGLGVVQGLRSISHGLVTEGLVMIAQVLAFGLFAYTVGNHQINR